MQTHKFRFGSRRVTLYRQNEPGSNWYMCVYLKEEKRQYRKSVGTNDRKEAVELATDRLVEVFARIQTGQRVMSAKLGELKRLFFLHLDKQVKDKTLSAKTVQNQTYRIGLGINYLAQAIKPVPKSVLEVSVDAIPADLWHGYLDWRLAKKADIRRDVVRDELLVIRKMFLWGQKEKLVQERTIPKWDFSIETEAPIRERISQRQYSEVVSTIRPWVKEVKRDVEIYNRTLLQHVFLAVANCGLRSGEAFGLRNSDVEVRKNKGEVLILVRGETSKVRKTRHVLLLPSSGGGGKPINYLIRWLDDHQRHRKPEDFVFSTFDDGQRSCRDQFYHSYKQLRGKLAPKKLDFVDLYHCRHFYITNRLLAGESIHLIAKACGTSVKEIEATYSNVINEITMRKFGEREVVYDRDGSFDIVAVPKRRGSLNVAQHRRRT